MQRIDNSKIIETPKVLPPQEEERLKASRVAPAFKGNPKTPLKAIREFCLKCTGAPKAVKECKSVNCEMFPFRFGKNPYHTKTLADEERKRRSDAARKRFSKRNFV
ncbi:MAG: hypothetical protein ACQ9MH_13175 [Nitrospinales bacterium]